MPPHCRERYVKRKRCHSNCSCTGIFLSCLRILFHSNSPFSTLTEIPESYFNLPLCIRSVWRSGSNLDDAKCLRFVYVHPRDTLWHIFANDSIQSIPNVHGKIFPLCRGSYVAFVLFYIFRQALRSNFIYRKLQHYLAYEGLNIRILMRTCNIKGFLIFYKEYCTNNFLFECIYRQKRTVLILISLKYQYTRIF